MASITAVMAVTPAVASSASETSDPPAGAVCAARWDIAGRLRSSNLDDRTAGCLCPMSKTDDTNLVPGSQKPAGLRDRPWRALPPEVAAALRPFVPDTAEEMIEAIREAVPAYARPLEGA